MRLELTTLSLGSDLARCAPMCASVRIRLRHGRLDADGVCARVRGCAPTSCGSGIGIGYANVRVVVGLQEPVVLGPASPIIRARVPEGLGGMIVLTSLPTLKEVERRLMAIFGDLNESLLVGDMAVKTVFAFLYIGADGSGPLLKPMTVVWMNDAVATRTSAADRRAYYEAQERDGETRTALLSKWKIDTKQWYATNTREPIRDNLIRYSLVPVGGVREDPTKSKTSSKVRYYLDKEFEALFDPNLKGAALDDAIKNWQAHHLSDVHRARLAAARSVDIAATSYEIRVAGKRIGFVQVDLAGQITQGVVERLAPRLAEDLVVLWIASSSAPVPDDSVGELKERKLTVDKAVLVDVVFLDRKSATFWFVEVVASDGPINEVRKKEILAWAGKHGILPESCRFVTAFSSRTHAAAKKRLPDLAWGTLVWFGDEPDKIVEFSTLDAWRGDASD
jgi:hypothetical protein